MNFNVLFSSRLIGASLSCFLNTLFVVHLAIILFLKGILNWQSHIVQIRLWDPATSWSIHSSVILSIRNVVIQSIHFVYRIYSLLVGLAIGLTALSHLILTMFRALSHLIILIRIFLLIRRFLVITSVSDGKRLESGLKGTLLFAFRSTVLLDILKAYGVTIHILTFRSVRISTYEVSRAIDGVGGFVISKLFVLIVS